MPTAKVIAKRTFFPYVPYLDSARHFCAEMERKEYVSWYDLLAAITLLALSIEALANTAGELHVTEFKDFESSSPKAKIRLICQVTGIEYDKTKQPFVDVLYLLRLRNQLAHPKFQRLTYESKVMPLEEAQKHYRELGVLLHDIEKALTPEIAHRSLKAVRQLEELLMGSLGENERMQISSTELIIGSE
jgi:hypothetical protein